MMYVLENVAAPHPLEFVIHSLFARRWVLALISALRYYVLRVLEKYISCTRRGPDEWANRFISP